jgi:hypothetical protein
MLSHSVRQRYADRFLIGSATAAGFVAFVIMLGMWGASELRLAVSGHASG